MDIAAILLFFIAFAIIITFALYPHLLNLIRCGAPKPWQICFKTWTIQPAKQSSAINKKIQEKLDTADLQTLQDYRTLAFIIAQNQSVIFEKYWNTTADTPLNSFSAAKSITSLLIGIALDKGYINSIDQPVGQFLPQFANSPLTIEHLLTMTSGLNWNEQFFNPFSHVIRAFYSNDLNKLIKNLKIIQEPGKIWSYQCANTLLLGLILEKATGQKIHQFATKHLWQPLGTEHQALWIKDKNNITKTFCCFYATPMDWLRIGLMILNNGFFNGRQIISTDYLTLMTRKAGKINKSGSPVPYGLHIWIGRYGRMEFPYLRGMFGQYIIILPEKNAVIVRLGYKRVKERYYMPVDVPVYVKIALKYLS